LSFKARVKSSEVIVVPIFLWAVVFLTLPAGSGCCCYSVGAGGACSGRGVDGLEDDGGGVAGLDGVASFDDAG
jgi:hypothetical protein